MELLLNALWLLFSAGALLTWLYLGRTARTNRSLCYGSVILGCALVLLFPVISMTDDLYAQQLTVEDASATSKKLLKIADRSKAPVNVHHPLSGVLLFSSDDPSWQAIGLLRCPSQTVVSSLAPVHSSGRAPPFHFIPDLHEASTIVLWP
jgi:hypothetical protein